MSVFGSNYRCEQLLGLMTKVASRTRMRHTDEKVQECMLTATTEIKRVIEG
jgi:hypothetical protein